MNKQELINKYKELENGTFDIGAIAVCQSILKNLEQLDEPGKVKIPQFVADWIEEVKSMYTLFTAMEYGNSEIDKWLGNQANQEIFALAWIFGYEVEEEKRYIIKLKGVPDGAKFLKYAKVTQEWYFGMRRHYSDIEVSHTRKELEDAGFGWVFDCEGIEIEEVTE